MHFFFPWRIHRTPRASRRRRVFPALSPIHALTSSRPAVDAKLHVAPLNGFGSVRWFAACSLSSLVSCRSNLTHTLTAPCPLVPWSNVPLSETLTLARSPTHPLIPLVGHVSAARTPSPCPLVTLRNWPSHRLPIPPDLKFPGKLPDLTLPFCLFHEP